LKIATWNIKQAVAPKKPLDQLWQWAEETIEPDVIVLTEAKVPKTGVPPGWTAVWKPDGIDPKRKWGTVVAGRGVELRSVTEVQVGRKTHSLDVEWPAAVQVVDIIQGGDRWATLIGFYAVTLDKDGKSCGHGGYSVPRMMEQLQPLFDSDRAERLLLAGDLNLWPSHFGDYFEQFGLYDLIDLTSEDREPLERCANCDGEPEGCGHLWTHKNGNSPNAAVQQIDFIFSTEALARQLTDIYGGVGEFEDAWDVSDHAPVVAEFE
jgi:hypothetical protein